VVVLNGIPDNEEEEEGKGGHGSKGDEGLHVGHTIVHIVIESADDEVASVKHHHIERDEEVYDHHQRVNAPRLGEHIHVVVPLLREGQHRQDHVRHQQIHTQQDDPPNPLRLLQLRSSLGK
jgi:hypothetical protein